MKGNNLKELQSKTKKTEHGELVLDERINRMTIDVFLREMWSETSKAWNGMMEQDRQLALTLTLYIGVYSLYS